MSIEHKYACLQLITSTLYIYRHDSENKRILNKILNFFLSYL